MTILVVVAFERSSVVAVAARVNCQRSRQLQRTKASHTTSGQFRVEDMADQAQKEMASA